MLTLLTIGFGSVHAPRAYAQSAAVAGEKTFLQKQLDGLNVQYEMYSPYSLYHSNSRYKFSQISSYESARIFKPRLEDLSRSNESLNPDAAVNWTAFTITSAAVASFYTSLFIREQTRRWGGPKVPFYFNSRLQGRGMDKFGHFYATKTQASFISNLYDFSNVKPTTSALLGAGVALSVQSLIEVKDGRVTSGGFDLYDQTANMLGASWFYARERIDFMQRFNIRWFYYPSEEKDLLEPNTRFNEDYGGHTYWLSMRTGNLFPKFWPRFIVPAAGISLNDWTGPDGQNEYFSYHLSINPDFKHLLPQDSRVGRFFSEFLNGFYIPAPAVEVYPDFGFKLVFYGQR